MRITEAQLKNMCDELRFKRAKQYYKDDCVADLEIDLKNLSFGVDEKHINLHTSVFSFDGFNCYEVDLNWDSISKQIAGDCSCQDFHENGSRKGACKHIIAVLLKYIYEYQNEIFDFIEESEAESLINKLKAISEVNEDYKRELNMDVKFINKTYAQRAAIELKLGFDKKYVVKNMKSFLSAVSRLESLEFGKNFIYDPSVHKFKECDEEFIKMALEIYDMQNERHTGSFSYGYPVYNTLLVGKRLQLTDTLIRRFFSLVKDRKIEVEIDGKSFIDVSIISEPMPIKFQLGMEKESIGLEQLGEMPKPLDDNYNVFWYDGGIYIPPAQQAAMYKPFYIDFSKKRTNKMYFSKDDGEKIVSQLLPMMKRVAREIQIEESLKDNFYEEPLIIRTYLDKDDDYVTALVKFNYGSLDINSLKEDVSQNEGKILIRDIEKEERCLQVLKSFGFEKDEELFIMKRENDISSFVLEGINKLQAVAEVYYSESFKKLKIYDKTSLKGGISINEEDLLEFNFQIEGIDRSELRNIFNAVREKKKFYRLKEGSFINLQDTEIKDLVNMIDYLDIKDRDLAKEKILLSRYNAIYLDSKLKDNEMEYIEKSKKFTELTNNLHTIKDMNFAIPKQLDSIMRNYQKVGFNWFKTLAAYGFGGILADEMGLGKTLQTIAFIASEIDGKPSIVIAPTSLVYNWESEIQRFAPELKTLIISGPRKQREELLNEVKSCDIVITSYPLIRRDIDDYKNMEFKYCIIDEAQQIKNALSQNAASVKEIKAKCYFALTGTPMENSLTELWSIFDFIMPGYLFNHSKFLKIYETPIIREDNKTALEELNRHIKPFILRRLKKDVIKELPPKIEQKLVIEMTEEQKKLYAAYLASAKEEINEEIREKGFKKSKIKIIAILTRLRQICCDPSVFIENFKSESGKMLALDDLLEETVKQGHKVLLFSQFTSVLKNIAARLEKNNIEYMYLDGSIKSEHRMELVREFNVGDCNVFLISLKAGGTGLNLTGADVVIHFDPWWNPAVEEQATDRAHRIGQKKTVEVIKLLAQGTIEEKIFNLQQKKKEIIKNVIDNDMNEDNVISQMTEEDLQSLFS